ncbi:MAG: Clp1/GlmU family protein [Candidatus Caldarchaeum sp.]
MSGKAETMEIPAGKTLLVDGPATITVLNGTANIYNCLLTPRKTYLLRPWRRYPIQAETNTTIQLSLGEEAAANIVDTDETIHTWLENINELTERDVTAVLGGVDTGKTAFATTAVNTLVKKYGRCYVVSLDPGQTYFTPPTVIGAALANKPVHDLSELKPFWQKPVGSTSAASTASLVADSVHELSQTADKKTPAVIDMDGWVEGPAAIAHKTIILKTLACTRAIILGDEAQTLKEQLDPAGIPLKPLAASKHVKKRDFTDRKKIREWVFRKFLGQPSLKMIPTSWVQLKTLGRAHSSTYEFFMEAVKTASTALNMLDESGGNALCKRRIGLVAYLYDMAEQYLGIGLFCGYDAEKGVVKIVSSKDEGVRKIILGRLFLSAEGDELYQLD